MKTLLPNESIRGIINAKATLLKPQTLRLSSQILKNRRIHLLGYHCAVISSLNDSRVCFINSYETLKFRKTDWRKKLYKFLYFPPFWNLLKMYQITIKNGCLFITPLRFSYNGIVCNVNTSCNGDVNYLIALCLKIKIYHCTRTWFLIVTKPIQYLHGSFI